MKQIKKNRILSGILTVTVAIAFLLTACAGSSMSADVKTEAAAPEAMINGSYYEEMGVVDMAPMEEVEMEMDSGVAGSGSIAEVKVERKIIKNADLSLETMEYDNAYAVISEITEGFGGYIESSSIEGETLYNQQRGYKSDRWAYYTVRVPAEELDRYIDALAGKFNIINKSESANDISDQYYDAAARLSNLQVQEKRLLELMEQAGQLADLLEIERELANVRYEIEKITASLKRMDSKVSYSTVNITLQEVFEYQEKTEAPRTFGDRIVEAMKDSGENFLDFCEETLITIIYVAPILLLLAVIALLIWLALKPLRKRRAAKKAASPAATWQAPKRPEAPQEKKEEE